MATLQQKSSYFPNLAKTESAAAMKNAFSTEFHLQPISRISFCAKCRTGCILKAKRPVSPSVSSTNADCVRACIHSNRGVCFWYCERKARSTIVIDSFLAKCGWEWHFYCWVAFLKIVACNGFIEQYWWPWLFENKLPVKWERKPTRCNS